MRAPPTTTPWSMCVPQAPFFSEKMTPLDFLNTYIVNLVDFHEFEALLDFFSKSGQSDQMTMPARRASKFSAKRRAIIFLLIFQSLNSQAIPGFCEPWSECQPERGAKVSKRSSVFYRRVFLDPPSCSRRDGGPPQYGLIHLLNSRNGKVTEPTHT